MNPIKILSSAFLKITSCFVLALVSLQTFAQEKGLDVDVNVNKKGNDWYQQPWI